MTVNRSKTNINKTNIKSRCKELDIFGIPVTLVHDGNAVFKTEVGSVFTILLSICMITFIAMKLKLFVLQDQEQNYNKFVADRNLYDPDEVINLKENNFGFAFGSLKEELPPSIARIKPLYIDITWENGERDKDVKELEYEKCKLAETDALSSGTLYCLSELNN